MPGIAHGGWGPGMVWVLGSPAGLSWSFNADGTSEHQLKRGSKHERMLVLIMIHFVAVWKEVSFQRRFSAIQCGRALLKTYGIMKGRCCWCCLVSNHITSQKRFQDMRGDGHCLYSWSKAVSVHDSHVASTYQGQQLAALACFKSSVARGKLNRNTCDLQVFSMWGCLSAADLAFRVKNDSLCWDVHESLANTVKWPSVHKTSQIPLKNLYPRRVSTDARPGLLLSTWPKKHVWLNISKTGARGAKKNSRTFLRIFTRFIVICLLLGKNP